MQQIGKASNLLFVICIALNTSAPSKGNKLKSLHRGPDQTKYNLINYCPNYL